MAIRIEYPVPFGLIGNAAYQTGQAQGDAALGDSLMRGGAALAQVLGNAIQTRDTREARQKQLALDRERLETQRSQFAQTQARIGADAQASREHAERMARLQAELQQQNMLAGNQQRYQMDQGFAPGQRFEPDLSQTEQNELRTLQQARQMVAQGTATQAYTPALSAMMEAQIAPRLNELSRRNEATMARAKERQLQERMAVGRRSIDMFPNPLTGTMTPFQLAPDGTWKPLDYGSTTPAAPRAGSTTRDPNALPSITPDLISSIRRQVEEENTIEVPGPDGTVIKQLKPGVNVEQITQERARVFQLSSRGQWGTSAISRVIGGLAGSSTRPMPTPDANGFIPRREMHAYLNQDDDNGLRRLQEISNLTAGFTDPASIQRYMPEFNERMLALRDSNRAAYDRIREAMARVQVPGTPPSPPPAQQAERPAGMLQRTIDRGVQRGNQPPPTPGPIAAPVQQMPPTQQYEALRRMEGQVNAALGDPLEPANGQPVSQGPAAATLPAQAPQVSRQELLAEYNENRDGIDRLVGLIRQQMGQRGREASVQNLIQQLQRIAPMNAPLIIQSLQP